MTTGSVLSGSQYGLGSKLSTDFVWQRTCLRRPASRQPSSLYCGGGGTNYQSLYAKRDNKVSDARMYACQEDYIEHILHRRCTRFYKVRGLLFAEAFCIACKSKSKDDWEKVYEIWSQRRKKWPLVFWTIIWGWSTFRRRITSVLIRRRSKNEV